MIYSYVVKHQGSGPNGTIIKPAFSEDSEVIHLGSYDGIDYISTNELLELSEFPEECNVSLEEITPELKRILKKLPHVLINKDSLRRCIETNVGDMHDLLADSMKLIEFNIMLTSRLAADYFNTSKLSEADKEAYSNRNQAFLDLVDSGEMSLRSDFEAADEMLIKLISRYSKIQDLVQSEYADKLERIGIW